MSIYWGFVCRSHDPEIESEHWFNCEAGLLAEVYQTERAGEWPNDENLEEPERVYGSGLWGTREPVYWLRQHPRCDVALRSEYGDTRELASA